MKHVIFSAAIVPLFIGCSSITRTSQTRMEWKSDGRSFVWESPKDYTVGSISLDPQTGLFTVSNLSAQVDQAAVQAARDARLADVNAINAALQLATEAVKKAPVP